MRALGVPAQQVEVARAARRHGDRHVVFGAQLQVALDARRGVVGALAFVPVREQHGDAGALAPRLLAGRNELVEDRLGAISEVAELRFPRDECFWTNDRVACLLYTSPSPRDRQKSRMPSSA